MENGSRNDRLYQRLFGRFKIKSNELEWIEGKIYTNVAKDAIAVVRPETGA
jgi:glutamine cyclotransferase